MKYRVGDKVQIKTWEEIAKGNQVTEYRLINTEAINLPDGIDFGRSQDDKINERCKDRIDEIVQVDKVRDWYYLKNSKTIVTGEINDRFEILDL